jgi:hypothetical protein
MINHPTDGNSAYKTTVNWKTRKIAENW